MKCTNCKKYDDCRNGSGLTWPCGAYAPMKVTAADALSADLSNFECLEDFQQEAVAGYIACPDAYCDYDGLDTSICVQCKINWLQSEWES